MTDETSNQITGTIDDLKSLKEFWTTFECELPEGGYEWVNKRLERMHDPLTDDEKKRIQFYICYAHCTGNEVFNDPLFEDANKNAKKIAYDATFDEQLQAELSSDKD